MIASPGIICKGRILEDSIDFSRPFMPEELTPLRFTGIYQSLSDQHRLRYNQLHALYFNEQTMFFEKALARNVLGFFLAGSLPEGLKNGLSHFLEEEEQHSAMFRDLNLRCAPQIYAHRDFYFIQVPRLGARLLDVMSRRPDRFPLLLWLMHLQEEKALFFGRTFLASAERLEPHFLCTQRRHLADEVGHVNWDAALLDWVWPETKPLSRRFNAALLGWIIGEFFSIPKRSALRVVRALVHEFPELHPRLPDLLSELKNLGTNRSYTSSLYCRENVPNSFRRFDAWPEFGSLSRIMPSYLAEGARLR